MKMKEYEIHKGIQHASPYMAALKNELHFRNIDSVFLSDLPNRAPSQEEICLHFHRLGRLYDSNDINSVWRLSDKLEELKQKGWHLVWTVHNIYPLTCEVNNVDREVLKLFLSKMDIVFCHTELMKKELMSIVKREIVNYGYGVDFEISDPDHRSHIYSTDKKNIFLFVGNIREYKGIDLLLKAFKLFCDEGGNAELIIGGPQYRGFLDNAPELLKYFEAGNIKLINRFIYKEDWEELDKIVDVIILPYKVNLPQFCHGFYSAAIPHAAYHKKLIITTRSESTKSILGTEEYSLFFKDGDVLELKNAMMKAVYMEPDKKKYIVEQLYMIIQEHTWEKLVDVMLKNYRLRKWI